MGVTTEAAKDVKLFMGVWNIKKNMGKNRNRKEEAAVTRRARAERVKFLREGADAQMRVQGHYGRGGGTPQRAFRCRRAVSAWSVGFDLFLSFLSVGGNSSAGFPVPPGSICMVSGVRGHMTRGGGTPQHVLYLGRMHICLDIVQDL